jgi:hypothetical protein
MKSLEGIFESICSEVEKELKPMLGGLLTGPMIRGYLPQNWIFITEEKTVTFTVDKKGNAAIENGASDEPDVTIEIDHEYLTTALETRTQPSISPKKNEITFHTKKGETAFNFLKKRFGL